MIPERPVIIAGRPGRGLEGSLALPDRAPAGIVICHPHPLYGGDMDNPVVLAVAEAGAAHGLATLRFNFRGVGGSAGAWDEGRGEQDDVRAALRYLRDRLGAAPVALAGYSFGARMAAAVVADGERVAGLALVAPPLAFPGGDAIRPCDVDGPVLVVAGSRDEYCPPAALQQLAAALPGATVSRLDGGDHFFTTTGPALRQALIPWTRALTGSGVP
jgi:hypothetical protein